MIKTYAGIGSRRTPANICELMQQLGEKLALKGSVLRSGGADGVDKAFEEGCNYVEGSKEVFTPKTRWFKTGNKPCYETYAIAYTRDQWKRAEAIAAKHHPSWQFLKPFTRRLHARNCFQVLGISLQEPADFVICWTPDGARTAEETSQDTGGTGQAIRVASTYGVKVYNLAVEEDLELAKSWISL